MVDEIKKILVLGLGTMGNGISQVAAQNGYQVNVYEIKQEFLDQGLKTIEKNLQKGVEKNKISLEEANTTRSRITGYIDLKESAKGIDFVIEAVYEDLKIKINLFSQLDKMVDDHVIFASNTSTLSISMLGGGSNRGDRFVGMHFFNPVHLMKLCELIRGIQTSDETLKAVKGVAVKMGKDVIVAKDSPAFIVNRILLPMLNEAIFALDEGVGTVEDIDKGIKLGLNHPMGPFRLMDLIGLDTHIHVSEAFYNDMSDTKYRISPLIKRMVSAGKLGRKSGEGFYKY
ncbi:MAG: 3-hydroxybutyryl-CoA dehydrogenase [Candidatus Heimdallarchaeota archaeon]|nr:3-hydroxybutyryl-CoA dehydrogenase [Candidatus Heimdallarchaeota archaeon]